MSTDMLYRAVTPELEILPRSKGGDGRTVTGIAVPYGVAMRIDDSLTEMFTRGAFAHQLDRPRRVSWTRDHLRQGGTLIGCAHLLREDAAGLYGEFRTSRTSAGDETLALIEDGALDQLSIGFREAPTYNRRRADGTIERQRADLREVAVVMTGAYGDHALISAVRALAGTQQDGHAEHDQQRPASFGGEALPERLSEARALLDSLPLLDTAGRPGGEG